MNIEEKIWREHVDAISGATEKFDEESMAIERQGAEGETAYDVFLKIASQDSLNSLFEQSDKRKY